MSRWRIPYGSCRLTHGVQALRVCGMLKTVYFGYKARVAVDCPDNPWRCAAQQSAAQMYTR